MHDVLRYFFLGLALLVVGCGQQERMVDKAIKQGILLKGNYEEPADLDPQVVSGLVEQKILVGLFEGLVSMDPERLTIVPAMAERWEISEDQCTYRFFLRKDLKWSDGNKISAEDIVWAYQRILDPALGSESVSFFMPIKHAKSYWEGKIKNIDEVGIRVIGDACIEIELEAPLPYFLNWVASSSWYPVCKATILKHGEANRRATGWTRPGNHVGNGPFRLKEWILGQVLKIEKNPYYWDSASVKLNEVHFFPMHSETEERAFRGGQLHLTESLPIAKYATYVQSGYLMVSPGLGTYCFAFNTQKKPFDDERVRLALSIALDRQILVDNVVGGGKQPAYSFVPPGIPGYDSGHYIREDVQQAKQLLADAGYPDGKDFPKIRLLYNNSNNSKMIIEAMSAMWKERLGIDIELVNEEWKVFLQSRKLKDFEMVRAHWMGDYLDAMTFLEVYSLGNSNNHAGFGSDRYNQLLEDSFLRTNADRRSDLLHEAEKILMQSMPMIPVYYYNTVYLKDKRVKGWHNNLLDWHSYKAVYFE